MVEVLSHWSGLRGAAYLALSQVIDACKYGCSLDLKIHEIYGMMATPKWQIYKYFLEKEKDLFIRLQALSAESFLFSKDHWNTWGIERDRERVPKMREKEELWERDKEEWKREKMLCDGTKEEGLALQWNQVSTSVNEWEGRKGN